MFWSLPGVAKSSAPIATLNPKAVVVPIVLVNVGTVKGENLAASKSLP